MADFVCNHVPATPHEVATSSKTRVPDSRGMARLPIKVDLRPYQTDVKNQENLGACTVFSVLADYEFIMKKFGNIPNADLSELLVYYNVLTKQDNERPPLNSDTGTSYVQVIGSMEAFGACLDRVWKYDPSKLNQEPLPAAYADASKRKILQAHNVPGGLNGLKATLAAGMNVGISFPVLSDWYYARPRPAKLYAGGTEVGGHAVTAVGYDDNAGIIIFKNSWSKDEGDKGYFYLPYGYDRYLDDQWVITQVTWPSNSSTLSLVGTPAGLLEASEGLNAYALTTNVVDVNVLRKSKSKTESSTLERDKSHIVEKMQQLLKDLQ